MHYLVDSHIRSSCPCVLCLIPTTQKARGNFWFIEHRMSHINSLSIFRHHFLFNIFIFNKSALFSFSTADLNAAKIYIKICHADYANPVICPSRLEWCKRLLVKYNSDKLQINIVTKLGYHFRNEKCSVGNCKTQIISHISP